MSEIDRQRIAPFERWRRWAIAFAMGAGIRPTFNRLPKFGLEVDALHHLLVQRADTLIGCTDGSADQDELEAIGEAIEAYEAVRWPDGKVNGGNG